MPNAISPGKRSITFLENRKVLEWMEKTARARETDLAVILREATSAYYARHNNQAASTSLFALHHDLGGKLLLSGPREITDGTLILGVAPDTRELDVLRSVNGILKIEA